MDLTKKIFFSDALNIIGLYFTAGGLRLRFNIKWGINKEKNPPGSPWGEIGENDRHMSLEEKRKVRGGQS
ncbi:MAG: hypothetical protein JXA03_05005 [Bacteroidales bacterium]|nr:hypothetical protein [Bacteroidales bacterium]